VIDKRRAESAAQHRDPQIHAEIDAIHGEVMALTQQYLVLAARTHEVLARLIALKARLIRREQPAADVAEGDADAQVIH